MNRQQLITFVQKQRLYYFHCHSFMKKAFTIGLLILCLCTSCGRDNTTILPMESIGIITGMDLRKCACCWGWLVDINNTTYKFDKIPANSSLDLNNLTFPTFVKIKWRDAQDGCKGQLIEVIEIVKK